MAPSPTSARIAPPCSHGRPVSFPIFFFNVSCYEVCFLVVTPSEDSYYRSTCVS